MSFFKPIGSSKPEEPTETKSVPWVEKYRPTSLNDVSAQDHTVNVLRQTLKSSNLPHMLFYGPPGTGKTSTMLALCRELFGPELTKSRVLELNASDERGISIVRDKIKGFARTAVSNPSKHAKENYPCPPYKIIILDEADSMTSDAQSALRRTMETYASVTRFCLICNYVTRIIDPLASRCSKFRFKTLDTTNSLERLKYIAANENVKYEDAALTKLIETSNGDLRKAITLFQSAAKLHQCASNDDEDTAMLEPGADIVTVSTIYDISATVPDDVIDNLAVLVKDVAQGEPIALLQEAVLNLVLDGWSGYQVLVQIHDKLMYDELISTSQKNEISWILSEVDKRLNDGSDEHLEVLDMVVRISRALKV